jgi:carboxyl-terminal processing protease
MNRPPAPLRLSLPSIVLLLSACGGGGHSATPSAAAVSSSAWMQGQYAPAANYAALCAAPRNGTDPVSHAAYPDKPGTALDEKNWLRAWTHQYYLWFDEVVDQDPAGFGSDLSYFDVLKTTALTASGHAKDKFHFTYPTGTWESLSNADQEAGYGADFALLAATAPRAIVVAYTEADSPATAAGLVRGTKILAIDGVDAVNATDQSSVATLNAGLSPATAGESHTFSIMDPGATQPRAITLVSNVVTASPVQNVHTLIAPNGERVGYLLFNDNLATAEPAMISAINQLQAAGVQDLVLDIRYNGGGLLDVASEVAYMIAGAARTSGKTFELSQFNSQYPNVNPFSGSAIVPLGFLSSTQVVTSGQALPSLNLPRLFVLTGPGTCSASESIINSLQGVDVEVIQIGSTTCGKPYAFYPADDCGTTYFSIELKGVNAKGAGDYADGFTPANALTPEGVSVPGCEVADDFTHALGDSAEGVLSSALGYLATGVCPVAPAATAAPTLTAGTYVPPHGNGPSIKSFARENRILSR